MKLHTIALVIIPLFFVGASSTCTNTMLVKTASGPDSSCSGFATSDNRSHLWPVSTDTTLCHGWKGYAAQDNKMHDNSANNIRCSTSDGKTKLLYTQFANSLDCSGTGVDKEYVLNECHQGVPPSLYDTGVNMDCCTDPEGASCTGTYTGQAAVAESPSLADISIYENGAQCGGSGDTGTTGGSDTGTTGGGNTGTTGGGNTGTTGGGNKGTTGGGGGNTGTTGGGNTGTTGGTSTASSAQVVFSTLSSLLLFFAL